LDSLATGVIVVLARSTVRAAGGYQLDVLLRHAAQHGVAAVLVRRQSLRSITGEALALQGGVGLLDVDEEVDSGELVDELGTLIAGGARASLRRLASFSKFDIDETVEPSELVAQIASLCAVQLQYDPMARQGGALVFVDGVVRAVVRTDERSEAAAVAARLAADAAARAIGHRERVVIGPLRSTSTALSQLLSCSPSTLAAVARRAAEAGFDVEGWHCASTISISTSNNHPRTPNADLPQLENELLALLATKTHLDGDAWSVARPDDTVVVVRTTRLDSRRKAPRDVATTINVPLTVLRQVHPGLDFNIGIGTAHAGPIGLRSSVEESRAANATARLNTKGVSVVTFDSLGSRQMLAEWLITDNAREMVLNLLAPLDALGLEKAAIAIETLHAYLDERGSLQRTAERLHIHRNAVVYRIAKISDRLPYDLTDGDDRFALQLACRARLMATGHG